MRVELLDYLADPSTGAPYELVIAETDGDHIVTGRLRTANGTVIPIIRGVPRFSDDLYADSFALQWNQFRCTQLDSVSGRTTSADRFVREVASRVPPMEDKVVIDVGCGSGRFAEVALGLGATVIGVDLSGAVDAAYANLRRHPNMHVIQADARNMPIRSEKVNGLYSIGVLQHTPNPYLSARVVVSALPVGSWFAFTAYGRGPFTMLNSKYLVRPLTRHIRTKTTLGLARRYVPLIEPQLRRLRPDSIAFRLAAFAIPIAVYPSLDYASEEERLEEAILDTVDMLSPQFDHPLSAERLRAVLTPYASEVTIHSRRPVEVTGKI